MRKLSFCLLIFGVFLILCSIFLYFQEGLVLVSSKEVYTSVECDISVVIQNNSSVTRKIIAASDRCSSAGCSETQNIPLEILPWSRAVLKTHYKPGENKVEFPLRFFTNDPRNPEFLIFIQN